MRGIRQSKSTSKIMGIVLILFILSIHGLGCISFWRKGKSSSKKAIQNLEDPFKQQKMELLKYHLRLSDAIKSDLKTSDVEASVKNERVTHAQDYLTHIYYFKQGCYLDKYKAESSDRAEQAMLKILEMSSPHRILWDPILFHYKNLDKWAGKDQVHKIWLEELKKAANVLDKTNQA
ncbi:hypothetical protein DFH28DRAFT_1001095 [Melampsora americana]|nr:hypothetical protein DFH28DRAFT_1001095 [Melampsora americana]